MYRCGLICRRSEAIQQRRRIGVKTTRMVTCGGNHLRALKSEIIRNHGLRILRPGHEVRIQRCASSKQDELASVGALATSSRAGISQLETRSSRLLPSFNLPQPLSERSGKSAQKAGTTVCRTSTSHPPCAPHRPCLFVSRSKSYRSRKLQPSL